MATNAELSLAIRERATKAAFGRHLKREGATTIALDDTGNLVESQPDGSTMTKEA